MAATNSAGAGNSRGLKSPTVKLQIDLPADVNARISAAMRRICDARSDSAARETRDGARSEPLDADVAAPAPAFPAKPGASTMDPQRGPLSATCRAALPPSARCTKRTRFHDSLSYAWRP